MGWVVRVELTTSRATIWRPNQLGHTHHMARQERLELPTYCLEGSCSIQLSYWRIFYGAGDGNRTHATSLEGWDSTIELHPRIVLYRCRTRQRRLLYTTNSILSSTFFQFFYFFILPICTSIFWPASATYDSISSHFGSRILPA